MLWISSCPRRVFIPNECVCGMGSPAIAPRGAIAGEPIPQTHSLGMNTRLGQLEIHSIRVGHLNANAPNARASNTDVAAILKESPTGNIVGAKLNGDRLANVQLLLRKMSPS